MFNSKQVILNKKPTDNVNYSLGEQSSTFKVSEATFNEGDLKDGELLVKTLYISNDPAQRMSMQEGLKADRTYSTPMAAGQPVKAYGVCEVVSSNSSLYSVGEKVVAGLGWYEYGIINEEGVMSKVDESSGLDIPLFLGPLGITGLTAYMGLVEVGQIKKGQRVVISAAAGATGSVAVQLAKHVFGASTVIGIAGSAEKCEWVKSLGADYCVNYHENYQEQLNEIIGSDYVDLYFDNVGGEILSYMLTKVKRFGTVIACGAISGYNDRQKMAVRNWGEIITNSLKVSGFIVINYMDRFSEAIDVLVKAVKEGKIGITNAVSVVDLSKDENKIEKIPTTWQLLFSNEKPSGKLVTKLA